MNKPKGIDISHYQGAVNWAKVTQNIEFVFIKATEGGTYIDPKFMANWAGAQTVGLPVGAYHFFDPGQDAGLQAKHFCELLDRVTGRRLPPMLDVETTGDVSQAMLTLRIQTWLSAVEKHTGQKPLLYTYSSFATVQRLAKKFSAYKLWIAQYGATTPNLCGWPSWEFWQYSSKGKVPGITGNVDLDYFTGTIAELHSLLA